MYSPIMWAEPNRLKQLKEKRTLENMENIQKKKTEKKPHTPKVKVFDVFYRIPIFVRMLKISFHT